MFETGKSLSLNKIQVLFLRKYFNLHSIKQNEKHPYQMLHEVVLEHQEINDFRWVV